MQSSLFYVNGILEGLFGTIVWISPEKPIQATNIDQHGLHYSRLFAPMFITSCFVSILMAKEPDNKSKQLFSIIWLAYHINAVVRTGIKIISKPKTATILINIFHSLMSIWFCYYLNKTSFDIRSLSPLGFG
eukprot:513316_1